jgi:prepilin-type N-terminal cleavage/methylation domain-containing protein
MLTGDGLHSKIYLMHKLLKQAFTLIEILAVVAIVSILSGLIIVSMEGVKDSATLAKSKSFADSLINALIVSTIGEWEFDDIVLSVDSALPDGTVIPDPWGDNNCTSQGGPILKGGSNCVTGKCLSFTGSNNVDCGNSSNYDLADTNHTLSFWFKSSDPDYEWLWGRFTGGTPGEGYVFYLYYGKVGFEERTTTNGFGFASDGMVNDNKWHFLTITVSVAPYKYWTSYLDGKVSGPDGFDGDIINHSSSLYLNGPDTGYYSVSYLDDIRMYSAVIPISQIEEQYYSGLNQLLANGSITGEEYLARINEAVDSMAEAI